MCVILVFCLFDKCRLDRVELYYVWCSPSQFHWWHVLITIFSLDTALFSPQYFMQSFGIIVDFRLFYVCFIGNLSACLLHNIWIPCSLFLTALLKAVYINSDWWWLADWMIDRLIDQLIEWLIVWFIDWLIDQLIDWLLGWLIVWLVDWLIGWLIYCWLVDWLIDWLTDWLIDWLIDCLIDWLIDWLIDCLIDWLIYWLVDCWLVGWLTEWLTKWLTDHYDWFLNDDSDDNFVTFICVELTNNNVYCLSTVWRTVLCRLMMAKWK